MGSITAGGSRAYTRTPLLPSTPPAGFTATAEVYFGVLVDATGALEESNEGNNTASDPVHVDPPNADLSLMNLSVSRSNAWDRAFSACGFDITNRGPVAVGNEPLVVEYYLSADATFERSVDAMVGTNAVIVSIAPGATLAVWLDALQTSEMTSSWSQGLLPNGEYYLFAVPRIVSGNIHDPDPANDPGGTMSPFEYMGEPADLELLNLAISRSNIWDRAFVACSFEIRNSGPAGISSETIRLNSYLSEDAVFQEITDAHIGDVDLYDVSIAAGETKTMVLDAAQLRNLTKFWEQDLVPSADYHLVVAMQVVSAPPFDPSPEDDHGLTPSFRHTESPYPSDDRVVGQRRPTFLWSPQPAATWYQLAIQKDGEAFHRQWFNETTHWTPDFDLAGGSYCWWVRSWGSTTGMSDWSPGHCFTIESCVPVEITGLSPENTCLPAGDVRYVWDPDPCATWYQVCIERNLRIWGSEWFSNSVAEIIGHPFGKYRWWVRGWSPDGAGPWSGPAEFSIGTPEPVTPVGRASYPVAFTWYDTCSSQAEWYCISVYRRKSVCWNGWIHWSETTSDGRRRSYGPVENIVSDSDYTWWIRAWKPGGMSPWSSGQDFDVTVGAP